MKKLILILLLIPTICFAEVERIEIRAFVPVEKVSILPASVLLDTEAVYYEEKSELVFKANKSRGAAFRLVHDGRKVLALVEGTVKDSTTSIYTIEEFATEKDTFARIKLLGLDAKSMEVNSF